MGSGGNNYTKYEAARRASGKLVLKDNKAEAIVVFLAEGYSVPELPQLLQTYLDIQTDGAEINTILARPDVQKRLEYKRREVADTEVDRKQPTSEREYQEYALRKLWTLARKEDDKVAIKACESILRASRWGTMPQGDGNAGDSLEERLGDIMGSGDGESTE